MKRLLIIPFFIISLIVTGTNYYVKNTGNDSNSGLDDAHAWAHHPWMSTWTGNVVLSPGDIVQMKRGDTWNAGTSLGPFITVGQSGTSGRPITTTMYGSSGNKPIIQITSDITYPVIRGLGKSFIVFDNLEIKHFEAARDTEKHQNGIEFGKDGSGVLAHDWIITNCDINNIPGTGICSNDDSYNITIGDTLATSCATNASFSNQIYDCGGSGIILTGRDPTTNHSNFNVYYNYIHDIDNTGNLLDAYGIAFSSNYTSGSGQGYSTGWPSYAVARFNRVENVTGHSGIDCHGGTYIYVQDNYIFNCLHGIYCQAADRINMEAAVLDHCYIERNTVENPGAPFALNNVFINVVAENTSLMATNCYVINNKIYYTDKSSQIDAYGINIYNVDGIIIEGNEIYTGGALSIANDVQTKANNVLIRNNFIRNWDSGIIFTAGAIEGDFTIDNNVIYSHRPFLCRGGTISNNIKIFNNTFLSVPNLSYPYPIDFVDYGTVGIANGAALIFINNILGFTSTVTNGYYIRTPATNNGTLTFDNNLYYNTTNNNPFWYNAKGINWAYWNTTLGYDTHGLNNMDPLFQNSSGSYSRDLDFQLQNLLRQSMPGSMSD